MPSATRANVVVQAAQRLAERAVEAAGAARVGRVDDLELVVG